MLQLNFLKGRVENFKFHRDRAKASGFMWGGSATAKLGDCLLGLKLWAHLGEKETEESLIPHLTLKTVNGEDAYWCCVWDSDSIWVHPVGWFGDTELEKQIPSANPNFYPRTLPEQKLLELGFTKLI